MMYNFGGCIVFDNYEQALAWCRGGAVVWFVVGWTARGVRDRRRQAKLMRKLRADARAQLAMLFGVQPSADRSQCNCADCTRERAETEARRN